MEVPHESEVAGLGLGGHHPGHAHLAATVFHPRFEIETAYTNAYGEKTRIVSDFPLNVSETSTWDNSQGTPRRYVRGTGTVGKGGGLVSVKIVNGDVIIRKK